MKQEMTIIGLMSGTSLDGVDLAACRVSLNAAHIVAATTIPYPAAWRQRLAQLEQASALDYARAHVQLGHYYGELVRNFIVDNDLQPDAVASHGHTIFHRPAEGLTAQIGDPDAIAAETGLPVVAGFRTLDVALGGQGAPLVPIGDESLFGSYDACLNLGGIANISYRAGGQRVAYDICPCNMALNSLAAELGQDYDADGNLARRGLQNYYLGQTLDRLDYYRLAPPKSLGKEWFIGTFQPAVAASGLPTVDAMRTVAEHIARRVGAAISEAGARSVLVTGGGAHNGFLVRLIGEACPDSELTVPDELTVDYKEALIFAYMGYLRLAGCRNTMSSVTGAQADSVGGSLSGYAL